ncbi:MAG: BamA/TamA family outer membrane protein, partial [Bacteroidota bacterium]
SGGSISNRAWKPRRLGPGSYNHVEEDGLVSYRFEQQGEIIFESSIEYRQKLVGFLEWAAFVDAGNIWTINEDPTRPGAQFQLNRFYKEIAVGAGLGLRFDFSFFIMRFDTSAKIYDPARLPGNRFILSSGFNDPPFDNKKYTEPLIYTLSIGYPF